MDYYPINKYLIKGEFLLKGIKLWNIQCSIFMHKNTIVYRTPPVAASVDACQLSAYMIHLMLFLITGYLLKWRNKLLFHNINLTGYKKVHIGYGSWSSWRHLPLFCFGNGGPSFFLKVAATMILKCFVKLSIIVYYGIW